MQPIMAIIPLRLFSKQTNLDFMGRKWVGFALSSLMILLTLGVIATKGLNLGIDFTGGVLIEVRAEKPVELSSLRSELGASNYGEISLQHFGDPNDVMIRIQTKGDVEQAELVKAVKQQLAEIIPGELDYRQIDYVGPTVGDELIEAGALATALAFLVIMAYVWFRFEWQFGLGAILALVHDAVMMVGFFAVTRFDFNLAALAAILTIIGYSINDSVVIYDRIRENMRKYKKKPAVELINMSLNDTLARTLLTAGTTIIAALCLALFGGEVIRGFSWSLVFGVLIGTYSSIYIAAPTLIFLNIRGNSEGNATPDASGTAKYGAQ